MVGRCWTMLVVIVNNDNCDNKGGWSGSDQRWWTGGCDSCSMMTTGD